MQKVAILFYGYMRSFVQTVNSIKDHIIVPLNADVYISTYSTFFGQKTTDPHNSLENPGNLTIDMLQFPLYGYLKDFIIETHDIEFYKREISRMRLPEFNHMGGPNWRSLSMYDSFRKVIRLRQKYEQANNIKYDVVILMRPDLMIAKFDIKDLDLNIINYSVSHSAPSLGSSYYFGDHALVSRKKNIDILETLYDNVENLYKQGFTVNNETFISQHLLQNNIKFERTD